MRQKSPIRPGPPLSGWLAVLIAGLACAGGVGEAGVAESGRSVWIQVASRAAGLQGSQWRTDLGLRNVGGGQATVQVRFYPASGGAALGETTLVAAGAQSVLEDVVGQMGASGSGALEVLSDQPVVVSSRTYALIGGDAPCTPGGTFGQFYPAYTLAEGLAVGESGWLTHLAESARFRSNLALTNMSAGTASVRVELFDGAGGGLADFVVELGAAAYRQETRVFRNRGGQTAVQRGSARVTVTAGSGVIASASVIDNTTNDPTTIPAVRYSSATAMYFPPVSGTEWETVSPASLGWNTAEIPNLLTLLEANRTRAFVVLVGGKIAIEAYFGTSLEESGAFTRDSNWYWASAGKTLTAVLVGKAAEEGLLSIDARTSDYLGTGWTSLTREQEDLIKVRHQLSMTTGLDDGVSDSTDYSPANLVFKAPAGDRWAYHNAPYTLLESVVATATGQPFANYFNAKLRDRIGMDGTWVWLANNQVFFSSARSMARFGHLILNRGVWGQDVVIGDRGYLADMISTSQNHNKSYGYLWWLNGKDSFMVPGSQIVFPGSFNPNAPPDMVSGLGKNGQYVSIVPSRNLVLVRLGESPDATPVPFLFLDHIWEHLNRIIE